MSNLRYLVDEPTEKGEGTKHTDQACKVCGGLGFTFQQGSRICPRCESISSKLLAEREIERDRCAKVCLDRADKWMQAQLSAALEGKDSHEIARLASLEAEALLIANQILGKT